MSDGRRLEGVELLVNPYTNAKSPGRFHLFFKFTVSSAQLLIPESLFQASQEAKERVGICHGKNHYPDSGSDYANSGPSAIIRRLQSGSENVRH